MRPGERHGQARPIALVLAAGSLALASYLGIVGVTRLTGGPAPVLDREPSTLIKPVPAGQTSPAPSELARLVLERNVFDSSTGSMAWDVAPPSEPVVASSGPADAPELPKVLTDCTGDLRLLAAVVYDGQPESSFAVLRRATATQITRVGSMFGDTALVALRPALAYVRPAGGVICRLALFPLVPISTPLPVEAPPLPPPAPAQKPHKPGLFSAADHDANITELGPDRYKITREIILRGLADGKGVVRGTRFFPQIGESRHGGVKIEQVAEDSTLYRLGMRSGDILRTLNGVDLTGPDGLLGAYGVLREQATITVSIQRGGVARNLSYIIE